MVTEEKKISTLTYNRAMILDNNNRISIENLNVRFGSNHVLVDIK
jgi:hypothetical protein